MYHIILPMCVGMIIYFVLSVTQLMDLFRGIVSIGEISERALNLTEAVLDMNAANYTVW